MDITQQSKNKLKDLAKEYGIDLSIVRRIAIINNYNIPFIVDELERIYEGNNKLLHEDRLKEYINSKEFRIMKSKPKGKGTSKKC